MINRIKQMFAPLPLYVIEIKHNMEPESAYSANGKVLYEGDEAADEECERVHRVYGLCVRKRIATESEKRTAKVTL